MPEQTLRGPLLQALMIHDSLARWTHARTEAAAPVALPITTAAVTSSCPAAVREAVPDSFLLQMTALLGDSAQVSCLCIQLVCPTYLQLHLISSCPLLYLCQLAPAAM